MEDRGTETGQLEIPLQKRADIMTEIPPSNPPDIQNIFIAEMSMIDSLSFVFLQLRYTST